MTPYEINILLHYYAFPGDHPDMIRQPPVWQPTIDQFVADKLILIYTQPASQCYAITERGKAYVTEGLCKVPLPVNTWRIPWERE